MHLLKAIPKQDLRSSQNEIQEENQRNQIWKAFYIIAKSFFKFFFAIFPKSVRSICFGI